MVIRLIFALAVEGDPSLLLILGGIAVFEFLEIFSAIDVKLKFMPKLLCMTKMGLAVVKKNGQALEYAPESLRTAELCSVAVEQDRRVFEDVVSIYAEQMRRARLPEYVPNRWALPGWQQEEVKIKFAEALTAVLTVDNICELNSQRERHTQE